MTLSHTIKLTAAALLTVFATVPAAAQTYRLPGQHTAQSQNLLANQVNVGHTLSVDHTIDYLNYAEEEEPEGADGAFEGEVSGVVAEAIEASDGVESCGGGLGAVDVGVVVSGEVDESSGEALSERLEELECAVEFVGIADGAEVAGADGEVGLESVGELEESVEGGPVLVGLSAESLGECAEESLVGQPGEAVWRGAAVEVGEVEDAHGGGAVHCRRQTRSAPAAVKRRLGSAPATKGGSQPFLPATKRTCPMM